MVTGVEDVLGRWEVQPREVARPDFGTMNEMFVVDSDRGRLVLRGHRRAEREAVEFEHTAMDSARAGDIPVPSALRTSAGDRVVYEDGRWWSLLTWIQGDQPQRGSHTVGQAQSMGQMLARIHIVLNPLPPLSAHAPDIEATADTIRRADALLSFIEGHPKRGDDEIAALRWITTQRDWLRDHTADPPPEPANAQTIHGDYHDTNLVFRGDAVIGVLDWERADRGHPLEEVVRAMHLSFRLDPSRSKAFADGYRARIAVTADDLDAAAERYAFQRDRSLWFFDELYRHGNERLRLLLNRGPFVPFETSWDAVRAHL